MQYLQNIYRDGRQQHCAFFILTSKTRFFPRKLTNKPKSFETLSNGPNKYHCVHTEARSSRKIRIFVLLLEQYQQVVSDPFSYTVRFSSRDTVLVHVPLSNQHTPSNKTKESIASNLKCRVVVLVVPTDCVNFIDIQRRLVFTR